MVAENGGNFSHLVGDFIKSIGNPMISRVAYTLPEDKLPLFVKTAASDAAADVSIS